jgi:hypothetical protein
LSARLEGGVRRAPPKLVGEHIMHRRSLLITGAAAGAALAFGAQARPRVSTESLPGVSFSNYKTYSWVSTKPPSGMNPVAYERIVDDVNAGMAKKGYQQSSQGSPADLALIVSVGAQNKTDFDSFGVLGLQTDVYQYTEGKLSVDAFDTQTKKAVWHGQAQEDINPDKTNSHKIDYAVEKMMDKFPVGANPPQNPGKALPPVNER